MPNYNLIIHASMDENKVGTMQNIGDQIGHELCTVKWYKYSGGWKAVYRPQTPDKREGICQFMIDAIANGFIGYDQNRKRRKAFFDAVQELDFKVSELDTHKSTDCCGLVFTAVFSQYKIPASNAEFDLNGLEIFGIPTTGLIDDYFIKDVKDFVKYTDSAHLESASELERGDILLADGHIAIYI